MSPGGFFSAASGWVCPGAGAALADDVANALAMNNMDTSEWLRMIGVDFELVGNVESSVVQPYLGRT
jgi:hypothetical protein